MEYEYIARAEERTGRSVEFPIGLELINEKIRKGLCDGVILVGPAGSGKLTYAKLMAKKLNAPVFRLSLTSDTCLEDFYRSKTFSEPIEKGGFLIVEGMEFCQERIEWWLKEWFLWTSNGEKLKKPVLLDGPLDIPEYTMSPNFVPVLLLNPDDLSERINRISMAWHTRYQVFVVPNKIRIEGDEE